MKLKKKILLSLVALAFAATMNAQVWIGGEVGFTTNHTNGSDHTAMSSVSICSTASVSGLTTSSNPLLVSHHLREPRIYGL